MLKISSNNIRSNANPIKLIRIHADNVIACHIWNRMGLSWRCQKSQWFFSLRYVQRIVLSPAHFESLIINDKLCLKQPHYIIRYYQLRFGVTPKPANVVCYGGNALVLHKYLFSSPHYSISRHRRVKLIMFIIQILFNNYSENRT